MRQRRPLRYALPGMLLRGGLPLALFVASCSSGTGSSGNDGATPLPSTPPTPQTSPAPRVTGAALVVVAHASKAPTARFQELDLAPTLARGAAPDRGQCFELPMVQHPWSTDRFQVLASQDGADLVVGSLRIGSGHTLVHRVLGRSDAREVELGASAPAAVLVSNGTTYVGTGDRVGYVDLREAAPRFTQVHQRTLYERKAFDRIVVSPARDWMVAIDDMVMPMWADSFALDARGVPTHRAGWELPGVINGHYALAGLVGNGGDGSIVLFAPYSIMDGHGHDLVALGVHGHALAAFPERLTLQNARGTAGAPPVLEEHVPRGRPTDPPTLVAGAAFSEWTALAVIGRGTPEPQLVFAAGGRGLAVLPARFTATTTATLVDVGGHCLDVIERGDALVALIGDAPADPYVASPPTPPPSTPSKLVIVRREGNTLRATATHSLDAPYTSLVH